MDGNVERVFICTDIEGVSGFVDWAQEDEEPERVRRHMTEDVNAAIEGVLSTVDAEILVNDSHGGKRNLILEDLHPSATLLRGGPRPLGMVAGVDSGADLGFQIGAHTRPGFGGVLEHVFSSSKIAEIRLNGSPVGEVELNALMMAEYDVPTALVTGDDALRRELVDFLPSSSYVTTKTARGMKAAECRHPDAVREDIRIRARTVVEDYADGATYPIDFELQPPIRATVSYHQADLADTAALWPGVETEDSKTIAYSDEDFREIYSFLRATSKI